MKTAAALFAVTVTAFSSHFALAHEGSASPPGRKPPEQLGRVNFQTSCNPAVEQRFGRAMALLHSFWASDAIKEFNAVLKEDPACAIAYWGIAVALQQNPLTALPPSAQATKEALAGLEKARTIGAKTQRERDYLAAIELVGSSRVDLQACKLEYSIVSPK